MELQGKLKKGRSEHLGLNKQIKYLETVAFYGDGFDRRAPGPLPEKPPT